MRKTITVREKDLSEIYYFLKNTLDNPQFLGDPYYVLLEELLLTLDAPLMSIQCGCRTVANALESECEFFRNHEATMVSENHLRINTPLINSALIEIYSLDPLRHDAINRQNPSLRLRLRDIRGFLSLTFSYKQKLDTEVVNTVRCFFDQCQLQRIDKGHDPYLRTTDFANYLSQFITEIHKYQRLLPDRRKAFMSYVPNTSKYDPEFLRTVLSETKWIVEQMLPSVHKGFSTLSKSRMLLQFFIKNTDFPNENILCFVPTEDQIDRFSQVAGETLATLKERRLDGSLGQDKDPLDFIVGYQWDDRRSVAGYVSRIRCSVYTNDWLSEPLVLGDHLHGQQQKERNIVSIIMKTAQERNGAVGGFLLTVPWTLGERVFGVLQINAGEDLPIATIRRTVHLVKGIFDQSELQLRYSDYFGNLKATNQMRAHLIMLEHDAPKFLSTPIINTVQSIQALIERQLRTPSKITKESVIDEISSRMAQLTILATHYDVFLHTLTGITRIEKAGELLSNEDFTIYECTETIKKVFAVLVEQEALIADQTFLQYLKNIELEVDISGLESATIEGAKALLTEVVLNLLSNSLHAITIHSKDSTRNPLRLDPKRGIIRLSILPERTKGKLFLKISVHDYGVGISETELRDIQLAIDEAELRGRSSHVNTHHFVNGINTVKGGRKRYGLVLVLEIVNLLHVGGQFRRPNIKSKVSEGTLVEVFFPVESLK